MYIHIYLYLYLYLYLYRYLYLYLYLSIYLSLSLYIYIYIYIILYYIMVYYIYLFIHFTKGVTYLSITLGNLEQRGLSKPLLLLQRLGCQQQWNCIGFYWIWEIKRSKNSEISMAQCRENQTYAENVFVLRAICSPYWV